jgi:hypothetical protein
MYDDDKECRLLTTTSCLGYGFPEDSLKRGLARKPHYIGVDGERLEGRGVEPDVAVPAATLADWRAGRDPELAAALAELARL